MKPELNMRIGFDFNRGKNQTLIGLIKRLKEKGFSEVLVTVKNSYIDKQEGNNINEKVENALNERFGDVLDVLEQENIHSFYKGIHIHTEQEGSGEYRTDLGSRDKKTNMTERVSAMIDWVKKLPKERGSYFGIIEVHASAVKDLDLELLIEEFSELKNYASGLVKIGIEYGKSDTKFNRENVEKFLKNFSNRVLIYDIGIAVKDDYHGNNPDEVIEQMRRIGDKIIQVHWNNPVHRPLSISNGVFSKNNDKYFYLNKIADICKKGIKSNIHEVKQSTVNASEDIKWMNEYLIGKKVI